MLRVTADRNRVRPAVLARVVAADDVDRLEFDRLLCRPIIDGSRLEGIYENLDSFQIPNTAETSR